MHIGRGETAAQVTEIVNQAVRQVRQQAASWGVQGDLVLPEHSARSSAPRSSTRHASRSHPGGVSDGGSSFVGSPVRSDESAAADAGGPPFPPPPPTRIPSETSRLHMNPGAEEEEEEMSLMMTPPVADTAAVAARPVSAAAPAGGGADNAAVRKKPRPTLAARIAARASERASQSGAAVAAAAGAVSQALPPASAGVAACAALGTAEAHAACVSSEHAELMRDMALSLMELHHKSKTSQARPVHAQAVHIAHCCRPQRCWHSKGAASTTGRRWQWYTMHDSGVCGAGWYAALPQHALNAGVCGLCTRRDV